MVTKTSSKQSSPSAASVRPTKIALCLSGGGYRAALFHLGALRCLFEMGILSQVTTISSVSGGSILSAYLAKRMVESGHSNGIGFADWERDVAKGFREFVRNDIRTLPVISHFLWNWHVPKWRVRHLERNYSRKLLRLLGANGGAVLKLSDLPKKPYFVFCATDVTFGVNWIFTKEELGDHQVGYAKSGDRPLSTAVAASSCFPPIFGPMVLNLDPSDFKNGSYDGADRASLLSHLNLSDGGVYDNLGIEPVDRGYETTIISDGGSPFVYVRKNGPLGRILRYNTVIMRQVGALRKRMFFSGITRRLYTGAYIHIGSKEKPAGEVFRGYRTDKARGMISSIRTDLDRFEEAEARILENHGYFEMHNRITLKLNGLIENTSYVPKTPHPDFENEQAVIDALARSGNRFSIKRLLRSVW